MIDKTLETKLQIVQHELSTKSLSQYITQNRALSFPIGSMHTFKLHTILRENKDSENNIIKTIR